MKVYIVTEGSYSDYHIERVFLDRTKAEQYVKSFNSWNDAEIEEYDTDDDKVIDKINYLSCHYEVNNKGKEIFDFRIDVTNTLDNSTETLNRTDYWGYSYDNSSRINIQRVINSDTYNEEKLKLKYQKVCRDLMEIISSLKAIEGWNEKMIQDWLKAKKDNFIPVSE